MKNLYKLIFAFIAGFIFYSCAEKPADIIDYSANTPLPGQITTGTATQVYGVMAIVENNSVADSAGTTLYDKGVAVSTNPAVELADSTTAFISAGPGIGTFDVIITGLKMKTTYYYRTVATNRKGVAYGDVKSFVTTDNPLRVTPYSTKFNWDKESDIADWKFDEYTGFDESGEDLVWFSTAIGQTSIACYWDGEDLTLISPQIRIMKETDVLNFMIRTGAYGSTQTKFKVYVTEDLENFGDPVKSYTFAAAQGKVSVPMKPYHNKSIYVVFVVEAGDIFFYDFSIAT